MKTEKEKMMRGELYLASDPELTRDRLAARELLYRFNHSRPGERDSRLRLLEELIGRFEEPLWIEPPFYCDYGYNIQLGENVYFNFNCVILDICTVRIGNNTMLGPGVQVLAATHPTDSVERAKGLEFGRPITIGNDVWIGGGAILCPGVNVGDRSVVAAGAVITKDMPEGVLIGGNPAKIIREVP